MSNNKDKTYKQSFDIKDTNTIKLERLKKSYGYSKNQLINLAISQLKLPKSMMY